MSTPNPNFSPTSTAYGAPANDYDSTIAVRVRRASWGAILGGFFTAAAMQMLLSLLGLAFGFWSIDPVTEDNPIAGLGTAAGIWWVVTGLISLAFGGWIAGYLAGFQDSVDGMIHGVVTWGLLTVTSFWLAGSAMGSIFNATANALGTGLSTAADWAVPDQSRQQPKQQVQIVVLREGEGGLTFADENSKNRESTDSKSSANYEKVASQMREMLNQTGKESLQPDQLEKAGQRLVDAAKDAGIAAAKDPGRAENHFNGLMDAFFTEWKSVKQDLDKDALANVITSNTDMSKEEAMKSIDRWQNEYETMRKEVKQGASEAQTQIASTLEDAKQKIGQQYQETKRATLHATEETLDAIGHAAFWSFISTLLGLFAAAGGGALGVGYRPKQTATTRTV